MHRINRIRIAGLRRLQQLELEVKPFMTLIGANGVGKTSLLDAFSLLSASASGNLNATLSRFGGITSLLTRDRSKELTLSIDMDVPCYHPLKYDLHLEPRGIGYSISKEVLSQAREGYPKPFTHINSSDTRVRYYDIDTSKLVPLTWEHDPFETSLSQVPKMFPQPEELRRLLATMTRYHTLDVGSRAPVKMPQPMKPASLPGSNGEDLVPYLYFLRESDRDRWETILDSLRAAFPDFDELNFPPVSAGMLTMTWKDNRFTKPIFAHELSEGTLRFLWLAALLQSPGLSTVTMIDEPEVSLHPELLNLLADLMREASQRTQLIVATHSDRFIRFLKPDEVVIMDFDSDGSTTAAYGSSLDLDRWLAEYSLDEVWRMGRMGGRA